MPWIRQEKNIWYHFLEIKTLKKWASKISQEA